MNPEHELQRLYSRLSDLCDELDFLIARGNIPREAEPANLELAKSDLVRLGGWKRQVNEASNQDRDPASEPKEDV